MTARQVHRLGDDRVYVAQGNAMTLLYETPDNSVDAVITDPPYSSGGAFRSDRVQSTNDKYTQSGTLLVRPDFTGDNRDQYAYMIWCEMWLNECLRVAKTGATIVMFTDWRQLPATCLAMQLGGWVWRGIVPWNKTQAVRPQPGRFRQQCEYCVWGSKNEMPPHGPPVPGFYTYIVKPGEKHHITGKPVELMLDLLRVVKKGGTVLDPFMGSGTTGVAAIRTGRRFIGFELDPGIYGTALGRLEAELATPQLVQHEDPIAETRGLFDVGDGTVPSEFSAGFFEDNASPEEL